MRYRCAMCRTSSPELSRWELEAARDAHRRDFHGGLIPDGEEITEEPRARLVDLPKEQRVAAVIIALVLVVLLVVR
jgi:hypothetical protein